VKKSAERIAGRRVFGSPVVVLLFKGSKGKKRGKSICSTEEGALNIIVAQTGGAVEDFPTFQKQK